MTLAIAGKLPSGIDRKLLNQAVDLVSQSVAGDQPDGVINLKLVDDAEIRALNKKYAGIDKATDVLSFNYSTDGDEPAEAEIGDIAISYETARRQAERAGTSLETEVVLLLVHGYLHLLGHDHTSAPELKEMDQLQAGIMKQLGLTYRNFQWDLSEV